MTLNLISRSILSSISSPVKNNDGFSFLSIVLLIILLSLATATLVTITQPAFVTKAMKTTTERVSLLRVAMQDYILSHGGTSGSAPATLSALVTTDGTACLANTTPSSNLFMTLQGWCGPYIDVKFSQNLNEYQTDGWGTTFTYNSGTQVITSCGPNRTCGDGDDITFSP